MDGNSIEEKKAVRLDEWKAWLEEFISDNPEAITIPNAAELLNDYYWRLVKYFLKPLLEYSDDKEHNLHYYKIISASEITVMAVVPLKVTGGGNAEERKQVNAAFAFFVAISILTNWKIDGKNFIDDDKLDNTLLTTELIDKVDGVEKFYPLNLKDEHIEWLKDMNTAAALPILSNSQTWRLIFLASQVDI